MALPDAIPVRYTEEEAGYVSFRPVTRQTFRLNELLDMVLSVTGKEPSRVRLILRSGTVVFHNYRYWWQGFEPTDEELGALLAIFPDPDPSREFRSSACTVVVMEGGGSPPRSSLELDRAAASRKGLLRRRSFWDVLLAEAAAGTLVYSGYSYGHHADLYQLELTAESRVRLGAAAASLAARSVRGELQATLHHASRIVFACPRVGQ